MYLPRWHGGKESTAMPEMWIRSLGQEDPLEEGTATHSRVLAWEIPRTEEPGGLQPRGHEESDTTEQLSTHMHAKSDQSNLGLSERNLLSRVRRFVTPWTVACQALPSMGSSGQECWSRMPFPSPADLPDPGIGLHCRQTLYHLRHQGSG